MLTNCQKKKKAKQNPNCFVKRILWWGFVGPLLFVMG